MTDFNEPQNHGRRKFLAAAGMSAGIAAAGSLPAWAKNVLELDPTLIKNTDYTTDVLVIGGGMAALFAAVKAHDAGAKVMILSKGRMGSSGLTPFAKGMFVFDPSKEADSIDHFVERISYSALGSNNQVYTRLLAERSLASFNDLKEWGYFDSVLANRPFMKPIEERKIPLIERTTVTHLIKENGRIAGAAGFSLDDEKIITVNAKSVILCTGSGGFKPNGFPVNDLTHDGSMMAYQIGAKITGKEWNDGHGTRSVNAAACYDNWGDMFERYVDAVGVEIHHDLGMEINYTAHQKGGPIYAGPGAPVAKQQVVGGPYRPPGFEDGKFEIGRKRPGATPIDTGNSAKNKGGAPPAPDEHGNPPPPPPGSQQSHPAMGGASAGMSIHMSDGLTPINDKCESNVPGLFAAGDALGSHALGGIYTQVGSGLTAASGQGTIAGEAAAAYAASIKPTAISSKQLNDIKEEILAPLKREAGYSPAWITQTLQGIIIPNFVLYIKKASMMQAALTYIEELRDHHIPMIRAANFHELRLAFETRNMVTNAEMKMRASLMRTESRGSHYRTDYPELDQQNWQAWINIFKGEDGSMQLEKEPFDNWNV